MLTYRSYISNKHGRKRVHSNKQRGIDIHKIVNYMLFGSLSSFFLFFFLSFGNVYGVGLSNYICGFTFRLQDSNEAASVGIVEDSAREVPTGPDPLHHNNHPIGH